MHIFEKQMISYYFVHSFMKLTNSISLPGLIKSLPFHNDKVDGFFHNLKSFFKNVVLFACLKNA